MSVESLCSEGNGRIEKGKKDRRKNVHTLTRRGRREIEARRDWEQQYIELKESAPA